MSKYATNTNVSSDASIAEIRRTLARYGATKFGLVIDSLSATIAFELRDRRIKFKLTLPDPKDRTFTYTPERKLRRTPEQAAAAYEQVVRQRYRALALAVKSKLESVESGIETFEQAFLAHIVMPDGTTVGDWASTQVEQMYLSGSMPPLLTGN